MFFWVGSIAGWWEQSIRRYAKPRDVIGLIYFAYHVCIFHWSCQDMSMSMTVDEMETRLLPRLVLPCGRDHEIESGADP